MQKQSLKMLGFEWKMILGWEGFERGSAREIESFKNRHICYIKLKTHVFRGLGSREISREKHKSFREKLLVVKQSQDSRNILCMKLKIFSFCLEDISWEEFSREIPAKQ